MATCDADSVFSASQEEQVNSQQSNCWGQLLPLGSDFRGYKLDKKEIVFGRFDDADVDYSFTKENPEHRLLKALSKIHFKLSRENTSTGGHTVLHDFSSNGTFVNKEIVGKNKKRVIQSGDEISLAKDFNKIFYYMDKCDRSNDKYPAELKDNYIIARELGRGAMGEVRLAYRKGSEERMAVKIVKKGKFGSSGHANAITVVTQIQREIAILKRVEHVIDVVDVSDATYLMLELVEGGELFDLIVDSHGFQEDVAKLHTIQMVSAIQYLHHNHITHRDLKPENILVKTRDVRTLLKITDFGLSKFIDEASMMKTFCGTPNYLAPEILLTAGNGVYTKAVDLWSLGVIVFICLVGYPPFSKDYKDLDLHTQITRGRVTFPPKFWGRISAQAKDFVKRLLTVDQEERMTAEQALEHVWLKDPKVKKEADELMYADGAAQKNLKRRGFATSKEVSMEAMEADDNFPNKKFR